MTSAALSAAQQRCLDIDLFARTVIAHHLYEYREQLRDAVRVALEEKENREVTPSELAMIDLAVLTIWRDYADDHGLDRRAIAGPLPRPWAELCDIPDVARSTGRVAVLNRETIPEGALTDRALTSPPGDGRPLEVAAIAAPVDEERDCHAHPANHFTRVAQ